MVNLNWDTIIFQARAVKFVNARSGENGMMIRAHQVNAGDKRVDASSALPMFVGANAPALTQ